MELSRFERAILSNQLRILEALYPEERAQLAIRRNALEMGFSLHYDDAFQNISEDELPAGECREVLNILDMFSFLIQSYEKLPDKSGIESDDLIFHGFDGNNESYQMIYTRFLIEDELRFVNLKITGPFADYNSHMPVIDQYRRMLDCWLSYGNNRFNLSREQILKIIEARQQ